MGDPPKWSFASRLSRLLKVIGTDTNRSGTYDFLLRNDGVHFNLYLLSDLHRSVIISAKEVMFSSALGCLFVSGIKQNQSTDFHNIRRKGGTYMATKNTRFRW